MQEVELPSGAILKIGDIPLKAANDLKKAVMKELKSIPLESTKQLIDLYKDYICSLFSSDEIEKCLWVCMKRCLLNTGSGDFKIEETTFEPSELRTDFTKVQFEVAIAVLKPFGPALLAVLQQMLATEGGNFLK
jgi:hypothetical protein